jgi:hypothetical protein
MKNDRVIMDDESGRIQEEADVACFKVLFYIHWNYIEKLQ